MPETLLSPSNILLFGRVMEDLEVAHGDTIHDPFVEPRESASGFLAKELYHYHGDPEKHCRFARIYGFSYEGRYYELPMPALFLVHGDGAIAETVAVDDARAARAPDDPSRSGMAAQDFSFADNLRVWSYDRADLSIRLDVDSGTFEQILLDLVLGGGGGPSVSGARVSGARVSGARVSGARVRGARVAGARVGVGRDGDTSD